MHRKLLPASTTTNETQECFDFCDPTCIHNCYTYPDHYFPPPSPPILPPNNAISPYWAIVASLFTVVFILIGFYILKVKCYSDWCVRRRNNRSFSYQSDRLDEEIQVGHPIWLITTIGLQPSIINSIAVCKYKKGEKLIEGSECSVCLNEFQEDETLRVLPKCNHTFHVSCIDTWLQAHINCPICRANIVPNNATSDETITSVNSVDESSETVVRNESIIVVLENSEETGQAGETQEFTHESISNVDENKEIILDDTGKGMSYVSMDSSVGHRNYDSEHQRVNVLKKGGEYSTQFKPARRSSSFAQCLHVAPISMKRSVSCSGRIVASRGYTSYNSNLTRLNSLISATSNVFCTV